MKKISTHSVYLILLLSVVLNAQDGQSSGNLFNGGLSFNGGIGYAAVKDEFISKEKYTGTSFHTCLTGQE